MRSLRHRPHAHEAALRPRRPGPSRRRRESHLSRTSRPEGPTGEAPLLSTQIGRAIMTPSLHRRTADAPSNLARACRRCARRSISRPHCSVQACRSGRRFFSGRATDTPFFPTVAEGGFIIGAAQGDARLHRQGHYIGNTPRTPVSVGFQLGDQAYRAMVFFRNAAALQRFESGKFSFSADVNAVALTVFASAGAAPQALAADASGPVRGLRT